MKLTAFILLMVPVAVQAAPKCHGGIDMMWLQDTTGSFIEDLPIVLEQIPDIVNEVNARYPNTYFGVAEFQDKPIPPLGGNESRCYKLGEYGKLSGNLEDFWWAYKLLYASGGEDLPEASFQALIDVALDKNVGWRPLVAPGAEPDKSESAAHVVVLITDAPMHLPGDIEKMYELAVQKNPEFPPSLPPNSGKILYPDAVEFECIYQDYPDVYQVVDALKSQEIYLILLTPNVPVTEETPDITKGWHWFNEEALGQPAEFYQYIQSNSSDFMKVLLSTLDRVTQHMCPTEPPATTAEPTSTLPTTLPTTTAEPASTLPTTLGTTTAEPTSTLPTTLGTTTAEPTSTLPTTLPTTTAEPTTTLPSTLPTTTAEPTTTLPTTLPTTTAEPTTTLLPTTLPTTEVPTTTLPITTTATTPSETTIPVPTVTAAGTTEAFTGTSSQTPAECHCAEEPNCPCPEVWIRIGDKAKLVHIHLEN